MQEERRVKLEFTKVDSLGDYLNCISQIADVHNTGFKDRPKTLWFRGLSHVSHTLVPSLYRTNTKTKKCYEPEYHSVGDYSSMHYAEDIRTQHYNAKNYHYFSKVPNSRVEWLEVMQHHMVKTRALDWSESSIHSLIFALEPFFNNQRYVEKDREKLLPCVWVLEPQKLNKMIYDYIRKNEDLQKHILREFDSIDEEKVRQVIKSYGVSEFYSETEATQHLDYIVNLSSIDDEILRDRARLKKMLENGDMINPYYYMLGRIYSDGIILENRKLPPLAVVQPYHSERIKAQKGVFTIFPFYEWKEEDSFLEELKIVPDAMEYNSYAKCCLHKIVISNPQKIALQLLSNGINVSWLYPELPIVASEIENHRIY